MRWEDERYCRLYTRDTTNWVLAPWQARAVLPMVMRKLDRAGTIDLGDDGLEGLAALVQVPLEVVEAGMAWWLSPKRSTFELRGSVLVMPNFLDAQEYPASDRKRAREHRERARDDGRSTVTKRDATVTKRDATVTKRDVSSREQTPRHTPSHGVTRRHSVLCCAVPSRTVPSHAERESARRDADGAPLPPPESNRPDEGKAAPTRVRASRLRPEWEPSEATIARFANERIDARACLERFRNHWLSASGARATKVDWDRTFTNWVLEDAARGKAVPLVEEAPSETRLRAPRRGVVELYGQPPRPPEPDPTPEEREESTRVLAKARAEFDAAIAAKAIK